MLDGARIRRRVVDRVGQEGRHDVGHQGAVLQASQVGREECQRVRFPIFHLADSTLGFTDLFPDCTETLNRDYTASVTRHNTTSENIRHRLSRGS